MSEMQRAAWLASLKPGDKVAVECNYSPEHGYDYLMKTVERVTPDGHIRLVGGDQYRPDGSNAQPSLWSRDGWGDPSYTLVEITQAVKDRWARAELLTRISSLRWSHLPSETLEKVAQALDAR